MKIGIIISRIGGVDGVALETEKWIDILKKLGHEIFILSGKFVNWKKGRTHNTTFPLLYFFSEEILREQEKVFFNPDDSPDEIIEEIEENSNIIERRINRWVKDNKIDCILSENASALPCHIAMGLGIKKFAEKENFPIICHDHDFYWERGDRYISKHFEINKLIKDTFPLILPNAKHAVINTFGKETFRDKFSTDSILVPNVMDFENPFINNTTKKGERKFFKDIGIGRGKKVLLQATRIVKRKGIDTAIKLLDKLNDNKLSLIITGSFNDDEYAVYYKSLVELIKKYNLRDNVIFAANKIKGEVPLPEAYKISDVTTYFSTYEGFGNAFVESVVAKKPVFVNNYKPVYMQDIGDKGFKTVMLEDNNLTDESVKQMEEIIYNERLSKEIGEYNFEIGKKYFSYKVLEELLNNLFNLEELFVEHNIKYDLKKE